MADNLFEKSLSKSENDYYDCKGELFWWIFEDKSHNFMNFFYRYVRSKTIHSCKSYTKSFFSTLFVVFCFEITFKIVKMRSISAVDFFS